MSKLFIIESPGKSKTLKKILGPEFDIVATYGHCLDLDEKKLSVDIKNDFEPTYVVIPSKKEVLDNIKKKAKKATEIYYATDEDREGCSIHWAIHDVIKNTTKAKFYRVSFISITKQAVLNAVANPRQVEDDLDMVNAQQARRIADRLVGWKTSFLTKQATSGRSAGRVQSVALRLLAEREKEIKGFVPQEYWELTASLLSPNDEPFTAKLDAKVKLSNENEVRVIYDKIKVGSPFVKSVDNKVVSIKPYPPFVTQSLISSAKNNFGWSNQKTMKVAQDLYEGCGKGSGFITYMRSDSYTIDAGSLTAIRDYIFTTLGNSYLPDTPNFYKNKKSAQSAHTAIQPTSVFTTQVESGDHRRLYELIWKRTVASQSVPGEDKRVKVIVDIADYDFIANGSVIIFDGWRNIYDYYSAEDVILPNMKKGDACKWNQLVK